jgi:hypothetical protein
VLAVLAAAPAAPARADLPGTITTIAGGGLRTPPYDGLPATSVSLRNPSGVAVDACGQIYVAQDEVVLKVDPRRTITTFAGRYDMLYGGPVGDGGPATSARLVTPQGLAIDRLGNVYIADPGGDRVRKVSPDGIITTSPTRAATACARSRGGRSRRSREAASAWARTSVTAAPRPMRPWRPRIRWRWMRPATSTSPSRAGACARWGRGRAPRRCCRCPRIALAPAGARSRSGSVSSRACGTARVTLDGRRIPVYVYGARREKVKSIRGAQLNRRRFRAFIDLRGRAKGRYTVRIAVTTTAGHVVTGKRRYRTCSRRLRGRLPPL